MAVQVVYLETSELVELQSLKDEVSDAFVNAATVALTFLDSSGAEVSGETWPIAMDYVAGSDGNYQATVSENVDFQEGAMYFAKIVATSGGVQLTKRTPVRAIWNE